MQEPTKQINTPVVSICCICYNHELFVKDAIESFLVQKTTFPFEIVISDDCSKDSTRTILAEYKNKFPNIIRDVSPEKNLGLYENLSHVQRSARGKYIALCEGDDFWTDPYKLQKQVDMLEKDSTLIACVTNTSTVDMQGNILSVKRENVVQNNCEGIYDIHAFFQKPQHQYPTATVCFRSTHIEEILRKYQHCKNPFLGDWPLWIILHSYGKFYYIDEVTAAYRINPNSITHTANRVARAKASREICRNVADILPEEYADIAKKMRDTRWTWLPIMFAYKAEKRYIPMIGALCMCIIQCPYSLWEAWKNRKKR